MVENKYIKQPPAALTLARAASVAIFVLVGLGNADAQTRRPPDTRKMTCEQAKALVQKQGAINLTTGEYTFDRYVSGPRYCIGPAQATRDAVVPTKDNPRCIVGQRCTETQRMSK